MRGMISGWTMLAMIGMVLIVLICLEPVKPHPQQCLPPNQLYVLGDNTSGYHVEGKDHQWFVLTNALEIKCQPSDPELRKYAQ